jgi:hypothetical protein
MQVKSPFSTMLQVPKFFLAGVIVFLCSLLGACATSMMGFDGPFIHQPDPVEVTIWPNGSQLPNLQTCTTRDQYTICLSEEPIDLLKDNARYIQINWRIKSSGWAFSTGNGIVLKTQPPFFMTGGGATNQDYLAVSKWWYHQYYRYTINVTNGTTTLSWDPWIAND